MLKRRYAKLTDIPEAMRDSYRQGPDGWVLDVEPDENADDATDKGDAASRLKGFRTTNIKLQQELKDRDAQIAALQKRTEGIGDADPDTVNAAMLALSQIRDTEDRASIQAGRFDEVVSRRMKARDAEYKKQIEAEQRKGAEQLEQASRARDLAGSMLLEKRMQAAVAAKKVRLKPTAMDDFLMRSRRDWKASDALDGNVSPADQSSPYDSPEDYIDVLVSKAPHLFEGGDGGGVKGGSGVVVNGVRTIKRSDISPTEYSKMMPDIAAGKINVVMDR